VSIDLDAAFATFADSTDFTVGIEEELAILDPETLDLVHRYEELRAAAEHDDVLKDSVAGELISSEIEIRSGRGETFAESVEHQRECRRRLFGLAAEHGVALGATGTHPWADYREQRIIDTEHYKRLEQDLQAVARRNTTFSLHVHVGINGADRAVAVCDRLRPVAPVLLAISANSPYLDGRDSGLHSARSQVFTKSFPRCGIPDHYGSWAVYRDYVELLLRTRSIVEYTQMWWSLRPHFGFGTVEVRIGDAQTTAGESEALAALIVACVAQAARDADEARPLLELPGRLVEENMWRAIRYGRAGKLVDFENAQEYPAADAVDRLLAWTAPVRSELGLEITLPEAGGAQRQRRLIEAGAEIREVYATSVRETADTYAAGVPA
jgi:carboxylate-amine ligase